MILEIIILPGFHETYDEYKQKTNLLNEKLKNNNEVKVTCGNYNISRRDNVINLISEAKGQYILFTTTSYKISNKLQSLIAFCKANEFDLGFFQCYRINDKGRKIFFSQTSKSAYTKKDNFINLNINSYIFSLKTLKKSTIRELNIDFDYFMIADAITKVTETTVIPINVETDEYPEFDFYNFDRQYVKEWYTTELTKYKKEFGIEDGEFIKGDLVQKIIVYLIRLRFACNRNNRNKQILELNEIDEFYKLIKDIYKNINDDYLIQYNLLGKAILPKYMCFNSLSLKYDNRLKLETVHGKRDFFVCHRNQIIERSNNIQLDIKAINNSIDELEVDAEIVNGYCLDKSKFKIISIVGGEKVFSKFTEIYSDDKYFGRVEKTGLNIHIKIPRSKLRNTNKIWFELRMGRSIVVLPLRFVKTAARLTNGLSNSYFYKFGYIFKYDSAAKCLTLTKFSKTSLAASEIKLWFDFLKIIFNNDFQRSKLAKTYSAFSAIITRTLYWLTYPLVSKKIWITFDQLFKGGDNGENFFKYVRNQQNSPVDIYYIINKNSEDYHRLRRKKYAGVVPFKSLMCKILAMHAQIVLATRVDVKQYLGFSNIEDAYYRNLLKYKVICLQHGLSIQEIAEYQNRLFDNTKLYFCASEYEIKNLMQNKYGYAKKNLILTGLPRYDALDSNPQKIILIAPTWRRNVTAGTNRKGETHLYSENFKYSEYYKIYNSLINNQKLISSAKRNGYRILYLIHPILSPQINDFISNDYVEIVPGADGRTSYERILSEASLMITDHSGIQYDFAYMRKPIIYYHPKTLPPQYMAKTMNYKEMGFGPICETESDLVSNIIFYIENQCEVQDEYLQRIDSFFKFKDRNNSKRIYNYLIKRFAK